METITIDNGFIKYTICENEVTIDNIKVYEQRQGTGRKLVEMIKTISRELKLPIGLYAEPMDDSISESELLEFYFSLGFELDKDDYDGKLLVW